MSAMFNENQGDGSSSNVMCVNPGENSLSTALLKMKAAKMTQMFLKNGTHNERGKQVVIDFPITIIGESKDGCTIFGGLVYTPYEQHSNYSVRNLTIQGSSHDGVSIILTQEDSKSGKTGASIHLDNVSVENSGNDGVSVRSCGTGSTMNNCNVSGSRNNGLIVIDGEMTISGPGTTIRDNCTCGKSDCYGLHTIDFRRETFINLAPSLTIEAICSNNGSGGNTGGRGGISIIGSQLHNSLRRKNHSTRSRKRMQNLIAFYGPPEYEEPPRSKKQKIKEKKTSVSKPQNNKYLRF